MHQMGLYPGGAYDRRGSNVGFYSIYLLWLGESSPYFVFCEIVKIALRM